MTHSVEVAVPLSPVNRQNRICHTIELDEKYCDVIVKRYIEQVGTSENVFVVRNGKKVSYSELVKKAEVENE